MSDLSIASRFPCRPRSSARVHRIATFLVSALLVSAALPAAAWHALLGLEEPKTQIAWAYEGDKGPEHWGDLAPQYAACKGELQSPVDLGGGQRVGYAPLSFRYRSNPLSVVHRGSSIQVETPPGSYMTAGGQEYQLTGFHFHAPGEHRINGVAADMELQLEHRDRRGRIAIVAVPMKVGRRMNSILSRIWDNMPGMEGRRFYGRQTGINPRFLLPSDHSYFSYVGSLTEPPCTEGIEWFVLANPVEVDQSYVQRILRAVGPNARPVQPLNGRGVIASFRR